MPTVNVISDLTKEAVCIDSQSKINEISKLIALCDSGRKGPVLIDFPMDIQRGECNENPI